MVDTEPTDELRYNGYMVGRDERQPDIQLYKTCCVEWCWSLLSRPPGKFNGSLHSLDQYGECLKVREGQGTSD